MGASSSKAVSLQKTASRAAAAAPKPGPPAAAAAAAADGGISMAERQREAELRQRLQQQQAVLPAEQRQENEGLVSSMNKLMAGVQQYQYELYRNPEMDRKYALQKKTKEEKEAERVGRLPTPVLKALLEEHARSVRQGVPLSADELARRYGADAAVLEKVLRHNSVPLVHAARDGRLIGTWPDDRGE